MHRPGALEQAAVGVVALALPRPIYDNRPMHPPTFNTKAEARTWALRYRAALSEARRRSIGARTITRLVASPRFLSAEVLLTYVGSKGGELDTRPLIAEALAMGKTVIVPVTRPGGVMRWSRLARLSDLEMTGRGILEPRADSTSWIEPTGGLCIVPGVCFRWDGHRIGFGGGYYDRFLASFTGSTMALTPDALLGVNFPVEAHDQPVSIVITERRTHTARQG